MHDFGVGIGIGIVIEIEGSFSIGLLQCRKTSEYGHYIDPDSDSDPDGTCRYAVGLLRLYRAETWCVHILPSTGEL